MEITIMTPQFDRVDDKVVLVRPQGVEEFTALKRKSVSDLKALGCGVWTETDKGWHMLYPQEWYDCIPEGLEVVMISDRIEKFRHGVTDDDTRYGMLAYGFLVAKDV